MSQRVLKAEPDWRGGAAALAAGLQGQATLDGRVDVLERVCDGFGEALYPGFAKLLAALGHFGTPAVKSLAAEALAHALVTARLPSTRVPAWGAGGFAGLTGGGLGVAARNVGPLEFLCLWLVRDVASERLDDEAFRAALPLLLDLVSASPRAAGLYADKLLTDIEDPTEGLHDARSRRLMRTLAERWRAGDPPTDVADAVLRCAQADRGDRFGLPAF